MASTSDVLKANIMQAIKQSIEDEVVAEFDKQRDEFVGRLERRKREIVAGIVLGITNSVSMVEHGQELRIVIKEIPKGE